MPLDLVMTHAQHCSTAGRRINPAHIARALELAAHGQGGAVVTSHTQATVHVDGSCVRVLRTATGALGIQHAWPEPTGGFSPDRGESPHPRITLDRWLAPAISPAVFDSSLNALQHGDFTYSHGVAGWWRTLHSDSCITQGFLASLMHPETRMVCRSLDQPTWFCIGGDGIFWTLQLQAGMLRIAEFSEARWDHTQVRNSDISWTQHAMTRARDRLQLTGSENLVTAALLRLLKNHRPQFSFKMSDGIRIASIAGPSGADTTIIMDADKWEKCRVLTLYPTRWVHVADWEAVMLGALRGPTAKGA